MNSNDELNAMIAWEQGDLNDEDTVALFQSLIDSGLAWQLQGAYGRMAHELIEAGLCERPVRVGSSDEK